MDRAFSPLFVLIHRVPGVKTPRLLWGAPLALLHPPTFAQAADNISDIRFVKMKNFQERLYSLTNMQGKFAKRIRDRLQRSPSRRLFGFCNCRRIKSRFLTRPSRLRGHPGFLRRTVKAPASPAISKRIFRIDCDCDCACDCDYGLQAPAGYSINFGGPSGAAWGRSGSTRRITARNPRCSKMCALMCSCSI